MLTKLIFLLISRRLLWLKSERFISSISHTERKFSFCACFCFSRLSFFSFSHSSFFFSFSSAFIVVHLSLLSAISVSCRILIFFVFIISFRNVLQSCRAFLSRSDFCSPRTGLFLICVF